MDIDLSVEKAPTLLIVADDELLRDFLSDALSQSGYSVVSVARVSSALRALEASSFDLVLTDVPVHDRTAFGLLAKIGGSSTRLVLMSDYIEEKDWLRAKEAGVVGIVSKPLRTKELLGALEAALRSA